MDSFHIVEEDCHVHMLKEDDGFVVISKESSKDAWVRIDEDIPIYDISQVPHKDLDDPPRFEKVSSTSKESKDYPFAMKVSGNSSGDSMRKHPIQDKTVDISDSMYGSYIYTLPVKNSLYQSSEVFTIKETFITFVDESRQKFDQKILHLISLYDNNWDCISTFFTDKEKRMAYIRFLILHSKLSKGKEVISTKLDCINVLRRQVDLLKGCLQIIETMPIQRIPKTFNH